MRVGVALAAQIMVAAAVPLSGCGGGDAPLALDERLPTDEEAAGFPVKKRFAQFPDGW